MSDHKCAARTFRGHHFYSCHKLGKVEEDGKWWCGIHAPSKVAARRAKRDALWKTEDEARGKRYARHEAAREIVEAALNDDAAALQAAVAAYRAIENARDA